MREQLDKYQGSFDSELNGNRWITGYKAGM